MHDKSGAIKTGLIVIGVGVALLVAQLIGWDRVWPLFPLLGGLAAFGGYVAGGRRDGGLAFLGTAATLLGLFFFGFTLGFWEWAQMEQLWPVFPLIGGVAFIVLFLAGRPARDVGALGVGCAALIVGGAGLAFTYGLIGGDIVKLWPLLLVLLGIVSLIGGLLRTARRE